MRIIIASRRLNFRNSAPKCSLYLASELAKLGVEVHILTSEVALEARKNLELVQLHKIDPIFANKSLAPLFYTAFIRRLKSKYSESIVLGNGYTLFDDITWIHFPGLASIKWLGFNRKREYLRSKLEKLLFRTSKLLLAPSSMVAKDLEKLYGITANKIRVQPHGVDIEHYTPMNKRARARIKHHFNALNKKRLMFIGAPFRKGFHLLLKALAHVKNAQDIELIAAGFKPSEEFKSLVEKLRLRKLVSFKGVISDEELKITYQSSDIFILPSLYDPFSLATLEAMACGLPVIISPYVGAKDIIKDWQNGIIVNPYDTYKFADVITTLINDDKLRRKIGVNARNTAKRYSWKNVAKSFLKVCEY